MEEVDVLEHCYCNQCGDEILSATGDFNDESDYQHFRFSWGYVSHKDMETWEFDLCESCLEKIVENFKIPAKIEKYY